MKLSDITISNFKSIEYLKLSNLKRINLFVGRPNVGKSNIIEALSTFSIPYIKQTTDDLTDLIRVEHAAELFHNGVIENPIIIQADDQKCEISFKRNEGLSVKTYGSEDFFDFDLKPKRSPNSRFKVIKADKNRYQPSIKRYSFESNLPKNSTPERNDHHFLMPPFGANLMNVLELFSDLKKEVIELFSGYNLKVVFDKASQSLKIMKDTGSEGSVFLLPYNSIADTLRRIIFFKTAVASNTNSVLLFEEPEAHAFPPYIVHITQEIIQNTSNQYFITTHSPFVLNDFLENALSDLALFIVDYKDEKTVVKRLSEEEIREVYNYGIDVFFNQEYFLT